MICALLFLTGICIGGIIVALGVKCGWIEDKT